MIAQLREEEPGDITFPQMASISFFFALRTPHGALPLRRAFRNDDLEGFTLMKGNAPIALRGSAPNVRMVLAHSSESRRWMYYVEPLRMRLICRDSKKLRPVHAAWHCVADRVKPGGRTCLGILLETSIPPLKLYL